MIYTINNKEQEKFLRRKTAQFDFSRHDKKEIREILKTMRAEMAKALGIGLSANQIGLDMQVFVGKIENKQYAVFNPKITKFSEEKTLMEEGCLSVPETYGQTERPEKVTLEGFDASGKKIKIKAWGLLAKMFQHETDHLNGILYIDKAKNIHKQTKKPENLNQNTTK